MDRYSTSRSTESRSPSSFLGSLLRRARRHRRADGREARQIILDVQPGQLLLGPDMIVGPGALGIVEAAERHLDAVAEHGFVHGERAAALRAEAALRVRRRSIALRRAAKPTEGLGGKMHEAHHRRARHAPAGDAMADDGAYRTRLRLIPHRAAQTSAGPGHGTILLFVASRPRGAEQQRIQ